MCKFYTFHLDFEENGPFLVCLDSRQTISSLPYLIFSLRVFLQEVFFFSRFITTRVWCCTKKISKLCHGFFFSFFFNNIDWFEINFLLALWLVCVFLLLFFLINFQCCYTFVIYCKTLVCLHVFDHFISHTNYIMFPLTSTEHPGGLFQSYY